MSTSFFDPEEFADQLFRLLPDGMVSAIAREIGKARTSIRKQVRPDEGHEDDTYFWRVHLFFEKGTEVARKEPKYREGWRRFMLWWVGLFSEMLEEEETEAVGMAVAQLMRATTDLVCLRESPSHSSLEIRSAANRAEIAARVIQKQCGNDSRRGSSARAGARAAKKESPPALPRSSRG